MSHILSKTAKFGVFDINRKKVLYLCNTYQAALNYAKLDPTNWFVVKTECVCSITDDQIVQIKMERKDKLDLGKWQEALVSKVINASTVEEISDRWLKCLGEKVSVDVETIDSYNNFKPSVLFLLGFNHRLDCIINKAKKCGLIGR